MLTADKMKLPFFKKGSKEKKGASDQTERERIKKRLNTVKSREKNEVVDPNTQKLVKGLFDGDG